MTIDKIAKKLDELAATEIRIRQTVNPSKTLLEHVQRERKRLETAQKKAREQAPLRQELQATSEAHQSRQRADERRLPLLTNDDIPF